jgi:orotidine-5'-phosphate decarboxylase
VPLYRHVARAVAAIGTRQATAASSSARTYPEELRLIREDVPAAIADPDPRRRSAGRRRSGRGRGQQEAGSDAFLIAASRSILYASAGEDFAEAARAVALALDAEIAAARPS